MERRLSAVLAADMVGYSRLVEADEIGTLKRQKTHRRELIDPAFEKFHGRVVKEMGDGVLVEFPSVVDAVQCAIQIQQAMSQREAEVPGDKQIRYRIGINLGDIVIDGDDILGDGVNIAARLEAIAPSSGICISDLVWQNLRGALGEDFSFRGDETLKNIDRKVRVWQWPATPSITAPVTKDEKAGRLADSERSIAVHPIEVFPDDPGLKVYSQGFDEDIAAALSKLGTLRVRSVDGLSSSSKFDFRLQGTMRIVPPRIRCNLQLLNNQIGETIWSGRFDGVTEDIFDFQDRIIESVAGACEVELSEGQQANVWRREANDPQAYDLFLAGRNAYKEYNRAGNARARAAYEAAVKRSPGFYSAIIGVARTHIEDATFGWSASPKDSLNAAHKLIDGVLAINPDHPHAHAERSHALLREQNYEKARLEAELAIALDPNNADAYSVHAYCMSALDLPDEALHAARLAIRLNPGKPEFYFPPMVDALLQLGRYEEALAASDQMVARRPDWTTAKMWKALALKGCGNVNDAQVQIAEVLNRNPNFTADRWLQFQFAPDRESWAAQLVELGLPRSANK